ncbi:MAG: chromosome segregation protein SMC [Gammaproteobacteria bacterium]|nr:chromosome segregation protein SMC [Gammaproteobacteria bacterium]MBL6999852.1 chromosome segregation protein SMC [Gammaproteobacteria bacterium]
MRLSQIKIAGFKSFVDQTKIQFPENLTGIVGPNGCGKSNVIDAVRWVMGESSAKHLRGESMEDVIFSGSSTRKPVGQASVELTFDNSDGKVAGEFAKYNEIAVKRLVTRAGQSKYFLNNSRCRRRDIADIFLGTGLGPRSYAIIEQGMVSRIIDAKPEDLRVYLEEAAGISKYKERRRETETRIRHTRENLDRLNDLREEIDKQITRLSRQSKTAERYKTLKQEQRRYEAEHLLLQRNAFNDEISRQQHKLEQVETELQHAIAEVRKTESQIEQGHLQLTLANDEHIEVQGRFYAVGAEISKHEQEINHQKNLRERNQQDLHKVTQAQQESKSIIQTDQARLIKLDNDLAELTPQLEELAMVYEQAQHSQQEAEQQMSQWQGRWDDFNQRYHQSHQAVQVENKAIEHIERQILQSDQRIERLNNEKNSLDMHSFDEQIQQLNEKLEIKEQELLSYQQLQEGRSDAITELRQSIEMQSSQLDKHRTQVQSLRGRLSSLEALQQNVLNKSSHELKNWLQQQQLTGSKRLTETLKVEAGYEKAVEVVLSPLLGAYCVGERNLPASSLSQIARQGIALINQVPVSSALQAPAGWQPLSAVVNAGFDLSALLGQVYLCADRAELELRQGSLQAEQRLVTSDGLYAGRNWLIQLGEENEHSGLIQREQEIKQIKLELETITEKAVLLKSQTDGDRERLLREEKSRDESQHKLQLVQRELSDINNQLTQRKSRAEQLENRFVMLQKELAELAAQQQELKQDLQQTTQRRNGELEKINQLEQQKSSLEQQRDQLNGQVQNAREKLRVSRDQQHQIQMKLQSLQSESNSTRFNLERMQQQSSSFAGRVEELQQAVEEAQQPLLELEQLLQQFLASKAQIEQQLHASQDRVSGLDTEQRAHERHRNEQQQRVDAVRSTLEQQKMQCREVEIRRSTLVDQLRKTEFDVEQLQLELSDEADIQVWQNHLDELLRKINNLGPINLAAIDEFNEQSERKAYLDAQNEDLVSALNILESAIRKIDKETKDRFKETFDHVNSRMQERFPKLFGGGQAHLELTEEDLLNTGVTIMARPPGKRVTSLQLLSGGEKALTAVALIFAIFELNPSPFCMLDEVDAPLDDANVGRFCAMVQEMSQHVQFIFITHNKVTMELAQTLNGVTMHEPGVSRLVTVNIDEAAALAAEG